MDLGTKYEQSLPIDFRKKDGIFYTPEYQYLRQNNK